MRWDVTWVGPGWAVSGSHGSKVRTSFRSEPAAGFGSTKQTASRQPKKTEHLSSVLVPSRTFVVWRAFYGIFAPKQIKALLHFALWSIPSVQADLIDQIWPDSTGRRRWHCHLRMEAWHQHWISWRVRSRGWSMGRTVKAWLPNITQKGSDLWKLEPIFSLGIRSNIRSLRIRGGFCMCFIHISRFIFMFY